MNDRFGNCPHHGTRCSRQCRIIAIFGLATLSTSATATPPPPEVPDFCAGVLCLDVMPVRVGGEPVWPKISMSPPVNGPRHFEYEIRYGARTFIAIAATLEDKTCAQDARASNNGRVQKVGHTGASVRACAGSAENPDRWLLIEFEYHAETEAERDELVINGAIAVWVKASNSMKAGSENCAFQLGQRIELDYDEFAHDSKQ